MRLLSGTLSGGTLASMAGSADDLRRRVMGWRAAERREQAIRAEEGAAKPEAALAAALELYDLLPVDVSAPDVTRMVEIEHARRAWHTLRTRLTHR